MKSGRNMQPIVIFPTLFYTDDDVFLYVDPSEQWRMGEVLSRITTAATTKIYQLPIYSIDAKTPYSARILEINRLTDMIEKYGMEYPINAERIL